MTTLAELDRDCPEHDRTSCSDENPVNAGVDFRYGHTWCRRCHGIWTIKAEAALAAPGAGEPPEKPGRMRSMVEKGDWDRW